MAVSAFYLSTNYTAALIHSCYVAHTRDFIVHREAARRKTRIADCKRYGKHRGQEDSLVAESEYIVAAKRSSPSLAGISRPGNISLLHWIGDYSPVLTILESCSGSARLEASSRRI